MALTTRIVHITLDENLWKLIEQLHFTILHKGKRDHDNLS